LTRLTVFNMGGGPAESIVVETSWGDAKVRDPVPGGGEARTKVEIPFEDWHSREDKDAVITGYRFIDAVGQDRTQEAPGAIDS
jgi:hypothetical protein